MKRQLSIARQIQLLAATFITILIITPVGVAMAGTMVALCVVHLRIGRALIVLSLMGAAGLLAEPGVAALVLPLKVLAVGLPVGLGILLGRRYWRVIAYATALLFVVNATALAGVATVLGDDPFAGLSGPDAEQFSAFQKSVVEAQGWILNHWSELMGAMAFIEGLMSAVIVTTLTAWWLRRTGDAYQLSGSFSRMRPPDWLAWVVIAAALLWFADQRWPSEWMRIASWNTGFSLAAFYWLNGLSVLTYAAAAFRPNTIMLAAVVVAMILLNLMSLLTVAGLFDTWYEFRRKIDELLAARQLREKSRNDFT